jgi:membrane-associated phospholipid phosphatase
MLSGGDTTLIPVTVASARKIFLSTLVFTAILVFAIAPFSKVDIDIWSFDFVIYIGVLLISFSFYCNLRKMPSFAAALEIIGFGFLATILVLILTYFAIALDLPLADVKLDAMDRALGFDWLSFIRFVDSHPKLSGLLFQAYQTISFQILLIPIALIVCGKVQRAYAMMTGYALLCVTASAISMFYPALGTYAYYGLTANDVFSINPYFALSPVPDFIAVRDHPVYTLTLSSASGLLCFPSVHAGVACLCTWAAWEMKWLRYPVLVLNAVMTVSAISHANHYLSDIIAGLGVASACIVVVTTLFYRDHKFWRLAFKQPPSPVAMSG